MLLGFAFCAAVLCTILPSCDSKISGEIIPNNMLFVERGSNIVVQCILDLDQNSTQFAQDVKWHKSNVELPESLYAALSQNVSQLTLVNATFDDGGNYQCGFIEDGYYDRLPLVVDVGLPPEPVENLVCITHTMLEISCQWEDAALDTNLAISDWIYYRKNDGVETWSSAKVNGNSYKFESEDYTSYTIKVNTTNALGSSATSISFHTSDQVTPYAPRKLMALPSPSDNDFVLYVNWTAPEGLPVWHSFNYRVSWHKSDSGGPILSKEVSGGFTRTTLTLLSPYTEYTIEVSARSVTADPTNKDLYWSEPAVTTATTTTGAPFGNPSNPRITNEGDSPMLGQRFVELEWDPVPQEQWGSPIIYYNVHLTPQDKTPGLSLDPQKHENLSYPNTVFHGIDKYQTYQVTIQPWNNKGVGVRTDFGNLLPDRTSEPSPPQNLEVDQDSKDIISISWEPPANPNGLVYVYEVKVMGKAVFSSDNSTDQEESFSKSTKSQAMVVKVQCKESTAEGQSVEVRVLAVTKNFTDDFFRGNESIRIVHGVCMSDPRSNVLFIGIFIPTTIIVSCIIALILWNFFKDSCREAPEPKLPSSIIKNGQLKPIVSFPRQNTEKESFDSLKAKVNNVSMTLDLEGNLQQTNFNPYHTSPRNEPKYGFERNHSHDSGVPESPVETEDMHFTNSAFEEEEEGGDSAPSRDSVIASVSRSISEVTDNSDHPSRDSCLSNGSGDIETGLGSPLRIDLGPLSVSTSTDSYQGALNSPSTSESTTSPYSPHDVKVNVGLEAGETAVHPMVATKYDDSESVGDYVKQYSLQESAPGMSVGCTAYMSMAPLSPPPITTSVPNGYIATELLPKTNKSVLQVPLSSVPQEEYSKMTAAAPDKGSDDGYLLHDDLPATSPPVVQISDGYIKHQSLSQDCKEYQDSYPDFNQKETSDAIEGYVKHELMMPALGSPLNGSPSDHSPGGTTSGASSSTGSSMPYSKLSSIM